MTFKLPFATAKCKITLSPVVILGLHQEASQSQCGSLQNAGADCLLNGFMRPKAPPYTEYSGEAMNNEISCQSSDDLKVYQHRSKGAQL